MLWVVPALAAIGCAAVIRTAARSGDASAETLAWSLAAIAIVANAGWYYDAMWLLPVIDWYVGCVALWLRFHDSKNWVALFVHAVAARLILHMLDAFTQHAFCTAYKHALNATFAWLLIVVATSGGHNGSYPHRIRDLLRRLRRLGSPSAYSFRGVRHGR